MIVVLLGALKSGQRDEQKRHDSYSGSETEKVWRAERPITQWSDLLVPPVF